MVAADVVLSLHYGGGVIFSDGREWAEKNGCVEHCILDDEDLLWDMETLIPYESLWKGA